MVGIFPLAPSVNSTLPDAGKDFVVAACAGALNDAKLPVIKTLRAIIKKVLRMVASMSGGRFPQRRDLTNYVWNVESDYSGVEPGSNDDTRDFSR